MRGLMADPAEQDKVPRNGVSREARSGSARQNH